MDNPETKEDLFTHIQVDTLVDYITKMITAVSNASSYRMYRVLSLSPQAAVSTILHKQRTILLNKDSTEKPETHKYIIENGQEAAEEINVLKFDLPRLETEFATAQDYETSTPLNRMSEKIMSGEINLDSILEGCKLDAFTRDNGLTDFITAAITKLGFTFKEMVAAVEKIQPTPTVPYDFMLEKKGMRIRFKLFRRDSKLQGYNLDLAENQMLMSQEGMNWCIVTDVYTEPGDTFARHVAVRMKSWPHYLYGKSSNDGKSVTLIEDLIKKELALFYNDEEPIGFDTALIISNIYKGKYETYGDIIAVTLMIGPKREEHTLKFSQSILPAINSALEDRFEGTLEITEGRQAIIFSFKCHYNTLLGMPLIW